TKEQHVQIHGPSLGEPPRRRDPMSADEMQRRAVVLGKDDTGTRQERVQREGAGRLRLILADDAQPRRGGRIVVGQEPPAAPLVQGDDLGAAHGSTSRCPTAVGASLKWFAERIFETASRVSPPG